MAIRDLGLRDATAQEIFLAATGRQDGDVASLGHTYGVSDKKGEARKLLAELLERAKQRYVSPDQAMSVFLKVSVGRAGVAGDHARYITRERATERQQERVWTRNLPEYADGGRATRSGPLTSRVFTFPPESI